MNYKPNLDDPRVNSRIKKSYSFARAFLSNNKPRLLSQSLINDHLGHHGESISKWLRNLLLINTNPNYDMNNGIPKEYILNESGMNYIRGLLEKKIVLKQKPNNLQDLLEDYDDTPFYKSNDDYDLRLVNLLLSDKFKNELQNKSFAYEDKSHRLWHPLQSVNNIYKNKILEQYDLKYKYDIVACAPTIILQLAIKRGMDLYLFALNDYLKDRTTYRQHISKLCNIDLDTSKAIINALFCGARLGINNEYTLYQLLNSDSSRMSLLMKDSFLTELRNDIKIAWGYIINGSISRYELVDNKVKMIPINKRNKPEIIIPYKTINDRKIPINSTDKWNIYFKYERILLNSIIKYMKNKNINYFTEHDGWNSDVEINIDELIVHILDTTGFNIKIENK
jgi:hypothetical protein